MTWADFTKEWNWADFVVQFSAALLSAIIAAAVAFLIVRAETRARLQEQLRREREAAEANAVRLRTTRGEAIAALLSLLQVRLSERRPFLPDPEVELAILRLLFDGSDDAYTMYHFVYGQLEHSHIDRLHDDFLRVRTYLVDWLRPKHEQHMLRSVRIGGFGSQGNDAYVG